ncbi:MAG: sugar ABC transporter permease [Lachnospiraceae bacterium]|nr:sugar ABC transporter permease [Lachnospiraceae bacterium]
MIKKELKKAERKRLLKRVGNRWQLYLLLLLPILYIVIFSYVPMGGLVIAFKDYNFKDGIFGSPWAGLENFKKFMTSYKFSTVMINTLTVSLYGLLVAFPFPIIFALGLNAMRGTGYKKIIQSVTYMPHFISTVVMVGILFQVLNNRTGLWGTLYSMITGGIAPNILGNAEAFRHTYVWSGVWQNTGYDAIIYIAALASVDQSLYEAAEIDGASRFQRIIHIDLPSILPTASILLILSAGSIMNVGFEKVFLMQNNLNIKYSEVISTYVYKIGLASGTNDFSLSTAIDMFNSVINFTLLMITNWLSKKLSGNGIF